MTPSPCLLELAGERTTLGVEHTKARNTPAAAVDCRTGAAAGAHHEARPPLREVIFINQSDRVLTTKGKLCTLQRNLLDAPLMSPNSGSLWCHYKLHCLPLLIPHPVPARQVVATLSRN
ncbi:hypothetical protein E2C01_016088 [Portunus trituberculatus]|uniref:Uncharacterized protein n=1 Tax=Portunus trituberculatus TaxID=210409 RepID=A0A5B7DN54_PORTR|nr:hypothetical protein [Portunus trituberculatus]